MLIRVRSSAALAVSIGILAFLWTEFVLNFDFHWFTVEDHVFGQFGLPRSFQLVLPASFVAWGIFFALGASSIAFWKTVVAAVTGTLAAALVMSVGPAMADAPDFWGIALWTGIGGMALVLVSAARADDWLSPAPAFTFFGCAFFWWIATGLDNFVPNGKGPHTVDALTTAITKTPLTAGTGAFGGLISTSWPWLLVSVFASAVCGTALGWISVRLAGVLGSLSGARSAPNKAPDASRES